MAQQVDLVMYKQGKRLMLGRVFVANDGAIVGQVTKDTWPMIKDRFDPEVGELVLAPLPGSLRN